MRCFRAGVEIPLFYFSPAMSDWRRCQKGATPAEPLPLAAQIKCLRRTMRHSYRGLAVPLLGCLDMAGNIGRYRLESGLRPRNGKGRTTIERLETQGSRMATFAYRAYFVGKDGDYQGPPRIIECTNDQDAITEAARLATSLAIELWNRQRLIGCFSAEPKPVFVGDALASPRTAEADLRFHEANPERHRVGIGARCCSPRTSARISRSGWSGAASCSAPASRGD